MTSLFRRISSVLLSILMALGSSLFASVAGTATPEPSLSPYGTQAIGDLASCLRTSQNLDVYYLVDASESLKESDKENQRATILRQDVSRWADILKIQPQLQIRIAGATFNSEAHQVLGWQPLNQNNATNLAKQLTSKVSNQNLGNFTNWRAGLEAAYSRLQSSTASCKTVIWFTDGGLWPSTGGDRLNASLRDLQYLCGNTDATGLPRANSSEGLLSRMRTAQIHIFGILLNVGKDKEKNEPFFRSLMKPILEESGEVPNQPGLPSGKVSCGENSPSETRTYAAGAFLEARSAADVAFNFMTIPAIVSGATMSTCPSGGEFWVDPGIGSFEYNTDATSWRVIDQDQNVVAKSGPNSPELGTGKIAVPNLDSSQKWKLVVSGGTGRCSLFVYPELYLELHQKSLITGQKSSITGQFVKSLTSHEKASLVRFKRVDFTSRIDGKRVDAKLEQKSGQFQIKNYKATVPGEAIVEATLKLETNHYVLDPISFKQSEQVYDSNVIPSVSKISFDGKLEGSKGTVRATADVSPAGGHIGSTVCFEIPKIISDVQDESAGKATDRSSKWKWTNSGLDSAGCIDMFADTNRSQTVSFNLTNASQAKSKVSALFDYSVKVDGNESVDFRDSQTADFESNVLTNNASFIGYLLLFLTLGFAIPFGILTLINWPTARFVYPRNIHRAEIDIFFEPSSQALEFKGGYLSDSDATINFLPLDSVPTNSKTFIDPPSGAQNSRVTKGLKLSAKRSLWPLNMPKFTASREADVVAFPLGASATGSGTLNKKTQTTVMNLNSGSIEKFAYVVFNTTSPIENPNLIKGTLVVYNAGDLSVESCRQVFETARRTNPHKGQMLAELTTPKSTSYTGQTPLVAGPASDSAPHDGDIWGESSGLTPGNLTANADSSSPSDSSNDIWS